MIEVQIGVFIAYLVVSLYVGFFICACITWKTPKFHTWLREH